MRWRNGVLLALCGVWICSLAIVHGENQGYCDSGGVLQGMSLQGSPGNLNMTRIEDANDMATCIRRCCQLRACDLAMMVENECHAVNCKESATACQLKHNDELKTSSSVAFVTRLDDDEGSEGAPKADGENGQETAPAERHRSEGDQSTGTEAVQDESEAGQQESNVEENQDPQAGDGASMANHVEDGRTDQAQGALIETSQVPVQDGGASGDDVAEDDSSGADMWNDDDVQTNQSEESQQIASAKENQQPLSSNTTQPLATHLQPAQQLNSAFPSSSSNSNDNNNNNTATLRHVTLASPEMTNVTDGKDSVQILPNISDAISASEGENTESGDSSGDPDDGSTSGDDTDDDQAQPQQVAMVMGVSSRSGRTSRVHPVSDVAVTAPDMNQTAMPELKFAYQTPSWQNVSVQSVEPQASFTGDSSGSGDDDQASGALATPSDALFSQSLDGDPIISSQTTESTTSRRSTVPSRPSATERYTPPSRRSKINEKVAKFKDDGASKKRTQKKEHEKPTTAQTQKKASISKETSHKENKGKHQSTGSKRNENQEHHAAKETEHGAGNETTTVGKTIPTHNATVTNQTTVAGENGLLTEGANTSTSFNASTKSSSEKQPENKKTAESSKMSNNDSTHSSANETANANKENDKSNENKTSASIVPSDAAINNSSGAGNNSKLYGTKNETTSESLDKAAEKLQEEQKKKESEAFSKITPNLKNNFIKGKKKTEASVGHGQLLGTRKTAVHSQQHKKEVTKPQAKATKRMASPKKTQNNASKTTSKASSHSVAETKPKKANKKHLQPKTGKDERKKQAGSKAEKNNKRSKNPEKKTSKLSPKSNLGKLTNVSKSNSGHTTAVKAQTSPREKQAKNKDTTIKQSKNSIKVLADAGGKRSGKNSTPLKTVLSKSKPQERNHMRSSGTKSKYKAAQVRQPGKLIKNAKKSTTAVKNRSVESQGNELVKGTLSVKKKVKESVVDQLVKFLSRGSTHEDDPAPKSKAGKAKKKDTAAKGRYISKTAKKDSRVTKTEMHKSNNKGGIVKYKDTQAKSKKGSIVAMVPAKAKPATAHLVKHEKQASKSSRSELHKAVVRGSNPGRNKAPSGARGSIKEENDPFHRPIGFTKPLVPPETGLAWNDPRFRGIQGPQSVPSSKTSKCQRGLTVRDATLRGGILAGEFQKMGISPDIDACADVCCKNKRCDIAMLLGNECVNVKCFTPKLCKLAPAGKVFSSVSPVATFVRSPDKGSTAGDRRGRVTTASLDPEHTSFGLMFG